MSQMERMHFQTEVKQLLQLMIHSLYSNKEIFLRELVSNASDALDKLRFLATTDGALFENESELRIEVSFDETAKTLTIADNGIGMTRDEVIANIGTIANSGTKKFIESLGGDQAKDSAQIGQFGVGFYSAFIVADEVVLETRKAGHSSSEGVRWVSQGEGDFTLETIEMAPKGTRITLHLREEDASFASAWSLRSVIKKYSDHINFPIYLPKEAAVNESEEETPDRSGPEDQAWERVNSAQALWTKNQKEITQEEYDEFYKTLTHDYQAPMTHVHSRVEGNQEYVSLFYIPQKAPFDLWEQKATHGIKLYVKRVFILEDSEHLMPRYLRFVRGMVDSADLPLNVSREILQSNKVIDRIKQASVKKVLGLLESMANDAEKPERYGEFWKEFGQVLKEGVIEDYANKERIAKLLRFASTSGEGAAHSVKLEDYVARMKEGQQTIYYITADSYSAAAGSPHLEIFKEKGIEVLLLSDRIDEWLVTHLSEFESIPLKSITKGDLDLGALDSEEDKAAQKAQEEASADLLERLKSALGEQVKAVRVTHRLKSSPACLVADEHDLGGNMQRLLQAMGQSMGPAPKPILEINPSHPIVQKVQTLEGELLSDWAHVLFDQALLAEGGTPKDPAAFVARLNKLLV
jgi:molecular chaperone HtpG